MINREGYRQGAAVAAVDNVLDLNYSVLEYNVRRGAGDWVR